MVFYNGRVFHSSLGHPEETFLNPDVRKMHLDGISGDQTGVRGRTTGTARLAPGASETGVLSARPRRSRRLSHSPFALQTSASCEAREGWFRWGF
jgi:hypothetical protein